MKILRRLSIAALFVLGLSPAFAQAPPAVPALPDTPRLTSYTIAGTTCACAVNFALYGNANLADYQDWVEVFLNGVQVAYNDPTYGWTITSPTGALASIARPITDAVLTFNSIQTGTVEIVGASRPARLSQWSENQGVSARNLNVAFTGIVAQLREVWDKINDDSGRDLKSQPGNTVGLLPLPAACVRAVLGFDSTGLNPLCYSPLIGLGTVIGPATTTIGDLATWSSTNGGSVQDSPAGTFVLSALSTAVNAANGLVSPSNGVGAAGRLLVDQGAAAPAWKTVSGDCSFSSASAITCLDTNGTAFGTFATQNYATPPSIGGTTPNAGAFTTLAASGTVSGAGFSAYLASPPAIGGTSPAAGSFTNFGYTGTASGKAVKANSASTVAAPGGPSSATAYKMQGLAGSITPSSSGNVLIIISGYFTSTANAADYGILYQISYGTGAAPTNNGTLAGTQVGAVQIYANPTTVVAADVFVPFSISWVVTGLTPGTAYWIDLAAEALTATGVAANHVTIVALEQ